MKEKGCADNLNDILIKSAAQELCGAQFPWAICGGYAISLYLNKDIRVHGDIDVCVFEKDRNSALKYMLDAGWNVYEFRGMGKVRRLNSDAVSDAGRNLMCVKEDCKLVKFYPCEEEGMLYHEFLNDGISKCNYIEVLFNYEEDSKFVFDADNGIKRESGKTIMHRNGVPYLAPEIVLLYKAAQPDRNENRIDFESAYPHMNDEQKAWLMQSIKKLYPEGHKWMEKGQGV